MHFGAASRTTKGYCPSELGDDVCGRRLTIWMRGLTFKGVDKEDAEGKRNAVPAPCLSGNGEKDPWFMIRPVSELSLRFKGSMSKASARRNRITHTRARTHTHTHTHLSLIHI